MSALAARLLTTLVALPLVIGGLWAAKSYQFEWAMLLALALTAAIACWEYAQLVRKIGIQIEPLFYSFWGALVVISAGLLGESFLILVIALVLLILMIENLAHPEGLSKLIWSLFGIIYISVLLHFLFLIYQAEQGFGHLILLLALVWAYDGGAYLAGSLWGRHKLAPAISPKKSWEGVLGGLILAYGVGLLSQLWVSWGLGRLEVVAHALVLSLLMGGFAQVGDLFESRLKRAAGVKDSGAIFPGHGGMLDRIDGLLLATPIFFFYLKVILKWL